MHWLSSCKIFGSAILFFYFTWRMAFLRFCSLKPSLSAEFLPLNRHFDKYSTPRWLESSHRLEMSQSSMTHRLEHKNTSCSVKFENLTADFLYVLEKTFLHRLLNFGLISSAPAEVREMVEFGGAWLIIYGEIFFLWKVEMKLQDPF